MNNEQNLDASNVSTEDKKGFCQYWPGARTVLNILRRIVKDEQLRKAIDQLIAMGDELEGRICKPEA